VFIYLTGANYRWAISIWTDSPRHMIGIMLVYHLVRLATFCLPTVFPLRQIRKLRWKILYRNIWIYNRVLEIYTVLVTWVGQLCGRFMIRRKLFFGQRFFRPKLFSAKDFFGQNILFFLKNDYFLVFMIYT